MKRSEAIKKLQGYLTAQDADFNIAEDVLDFIEKEIEMMPPSNPQYGITEWYEGCFHEWEKE